MSGSPAGSACSHVRAMRSWPAAARPITFHPLACAATPLRHQHRSRRLLLALAGPRLFSTAWPAASPAPPTPSPLRLPPPSSPRPRSPPRRHEELSPFPTPRASLPSTSFPFEPPPSYSAYLSLLLTYNRRLEWGRSRDLFLRCRSRFPLTEDVADAALLALSRLSIPQALQSFQLFLHQLRPTSPRLFNRMLALLCEHQGEEEEDGGGGEGVEGAAHLLQLMQRQGVQADAETFFHLSRLHLSASDADAAAAHYRSLSHLLPPSPSHPSSSLDPPPSPSHRSSPPPSPPPSPSPLSASEGAGAVPRLPPRPAAGQLSAAVVRPPPLRPPSQALDERSSRRPTAAQKVDAVSHSTPVPLCPILPLSCPFPYHPPFSLHLPRGAGAESTGPDA